MNVGDIYRTSLRYTVDGQQCYNVMHFRVRTAPGTEAEADQYLTRLKDSFVAAVVGALQTYHPATVTYEDINITGVRGAVLRAQDFNLGTAGTAAAAQLLPSLNAAVVRLSTGLAGRSRKGRVHVAGLTELHTDGGRLSTEGQTFLTAVASGIANMMADTYWQPCVWSRTIAEGKPESAPGAGDAVAPDPANADALVTGTSWSPIIGSMYSRRIGIGT